MSDCGCKVTAQSATERRVLRIALGLNAAMAVIGTAVGLWAASTGVLADALDMASDAMAYGIGLAAIGRAARFKQNAATLSGSILLVLGAGLLIEVIRRGFSGSAPAPLAIIPMATLSLIVNVYVLRSLRPFRSGEVHLRATWIFTRADVVASCGVIVSGILVAVTHRRYPDLIVGTLIGLYVIKEAIEILREARGGAKAALDVGQEERLARYAGC